LNDIAVANSGLIREYSLVDPRARKLMMAVKLWAKEHQINSAKDNYISSYAWINLVIFYLQCIGFVPNLQSADLMKVVGFVPDPEGNIWHSVRKLDTWYLLWEQLQSENAWSPGLNLSEVSVSALLYGFFEFYSRRFPGGGFAVSIKKGAVYLPKIESNKTKLFLSIEDPFETYDSHCPHDLGSPAAENGTRDLLEFLHNAESHLRQILLGKSDKEKLWPDHAIVSDEPAEKANATPNFKRFSADEDDTVEREPAGTKADKNNIKGGGPGRGSEQGRKRGGRGGNRKGRGGRGGRGQKPNAPYAQSHAARESNTGGAAVVSQQQDKTSGPEPQTKLPVKNRTNGNATNGTKVSGASGGGDGEKSPKGPKNGKPKHKRRNPKPPANQGGVGPGKTEQ
jgi:hypothetical protein